MNIETGQKNNILRARAKEVKEITPEIQDLILSMRKMMHGANGIGLAAPQIGVSLRIFVAEVNKKFYTIINPEIVKTSKELDLLEEGCLSLPHTFGPVERAEKIVITGLDQRGKKVKIKAYGLLARVFQHEIDHLNGVLFMDRAKKVYEFQAESE